MKPSGSRKDETIFFCVITDSTVGSLLVIQFE
jgi:hypothetical protein